MKISFLRRDKQAITLVELLLVAFIVFILIAMLLPVDSRRGRLVKIVKARIEIADIANAIQAYEAEYGRYPVPTNVEIVAASHKEDFTYGGPLLNAVLGSTAATPLNADVIATLMDLTNSLDGKPTVNANHGLNVKQIKFLYARFSGNTNGSGVDMDLVYRDPWGHPYIISLDLNGDHRCRDAFYKNHSVSQRDGATGFDGLTNVFEVGGTNDLFEYPSRIMVWSFGPDGKADLSKSSTMAPNKDNVVSWQWPGLK